MSWENSNRRKHLPKDWSQTRQRVLRRDNFQCCAEDAVTGLRCQRRATDVDHMRGQGYEEDRYLQSLCSWHHAKKSASEGGMAAQAKRKAMDKRFRRREKHPGDLT